MILLAGTKYYSRERNITRGNEILLAGTKYYSRGPYITRGNEILLAGMKYYSRKCINYSRDRKITCGNEILLAGIQYYSRKWIITRGKKYYSRERIITRGNLFITRGKDILLAGEKYWQYMAPEGFRRLPLNILLHKSHKHGQTCFVRCSRRGNLDNHYADSPDNDIVVMFWNLGVSGLTLIPAWTSNHVPSKVCDRIIHPFSTFKGPAVEVWE